MWPTVASALSDITHVCSLTDVCVINSAEVFSIKVFINCCRVVGCGMRSICF